MYSALGIAQMKTNVWFCISIYAVNYMYLYKLAPNDPKPALRVCEVHYKKLPISDQGIYAG